VGLLLGVTFPEQVAAARAMHRISDSVVLSVTPSDAYEADLARFATVSLPTGTLLQQQRLSWSGISLCGWHVAIWLNFACWAICFWWMHKLSSRQETMLRELQEQARRIEHLSKAEHQLLQ
jgi:hypothetical protein